MFKRVGTISYPEDENDYYWVRGEYDIFDFEYYPEIGDEGDFIGTLFLPRSYTEEDERYNRIDRFGHMRGEFVKEHYPEVYAYYRVHCQWSQWLHDFEQEVHKFIDDKMTAMRKSSTVLTEQLKNENPLAWAGELTRIQSTAEEIAIKVLVEAEPEIYEEALEWKRKSEDKNEDNLPF